MTKGGVTLSWRQAVTTHLYLYKGIEVSACHAVKTDSGKWKRVMQCEEAIHVPGLYTVYNLVTPSHRLYINGIEFTDEFEFNDPYQPLAESLKRLNVDEQIKLQQVGK